MLVLLFLCLIWWSNLVDKDRQQAHQEPMRDIIIIDLLTQSLQVIDNHLQPMKHLWNALIILHLEACQLVLENV